MNLICQFASVNTRDHWFSLIMPPWKDSRISLADSKDVVFKQAQTEIDWPLSPESEANYNRLTQLYRESVLKVNPRATVTIKPWDDVKKNMVVKGLHLGTKRMAWSAKDGVVDCKLKVLGTDNLYVAGLSVWSSAGISNPTPSIINRP